MLETKVSTPLRSLDRENLRTTGDDDPNGVHKDKVEIEIKCLRSRVADAVDDMLESRSTIVQDIAVELAHAHQQLKRKPHGVTQHNQRGYEQAARAPSSCGDALHAQHESVLGQVAAVRERIFFPHLPNVCLVCADVQEIDDVVAFEENMNCAGEHEPHDSEELDIGKGWLITLGDHVSGGEKDGAGSEESAEEDGYACHIREIARNGSAQRIVRLRRIGEKVRCIFCNVQWNTHCAHGDVGVKVSVGVDGVRKVQTRDRADHAKSGTAVLTVRRIHCGVLLL